MKFAVIFNRPLGLENYRLFAVDREQDVPGTVARGGPMCDEVGIYPLDGKMALWVDFVEEVGE